MSEALDKMVAAMVAEAERQDAEEAETAKRMPWLADEAVATKHEYNWSAVARAGLEAIREPNNEIRAGGEAADRACDPFIGTPSEGVPAEPADADEHWRFMIDAILKEPEG